MIQEINRHLMKSTRENLGMTRQELAHALCLSHKHIEQLEEGGYGSFYSLQHKCQVAKKVARQLGLAEDSIFLDGYDYPYLRKS